MILGREFKYNRINLAELVEVVSVKRNLIEQNVQWTNFKDRPNHPLGSNLSGKEIIVTVAVIEDSIWWREDIELALAPLFVSKQLGKLELYDRVGKYDMAILDNKIDWERIKNAGIADIVFTSPYPYMFGLEREYQLPGSITDIENKGTAETEPILEIRGQNTTSIKIDFIGQETKTLELKGKNFSGDLFTIDTENRDIRLGSNQSGMKYLTLESRWSSLPVGKSKIRLTGATGKLTFRERWVG